MGRRAGMMVGTLLVFHCVAFALNPSLDISQYAHTAWTARDGIVKGTVIAIAQTPDGYLWLGTEFGLLRFDGVRSVPWPPPSQPLPSNNIRRLLSTRDGRLWIGTNQGLASWKDGKLSRYADLAGQDILALLEDHEGTVWVGVARWPANGRLCAVKNGNSTCYGEDGSLGGGVSSLREDRAGNLWVGAATGLWRWKPGPPKFYPVSNRVPEIFSLMEDDNGRLLIAMRGGLKQLADGKVQDFPLPGGAVAQLRPNRLLKDRDGGLWIGTFDRGILHVHQGRTDAFTRADGLSGEYAFSLFEDREGDVWVATTDGFDRFRDYAVPTISVKQGLSNNTVQSVLAARDGSVWLGTFDGLDRWDNGRITTYRKQTSGLPGDSADCLFEDDRGRIWVSTGRGVAYFDNGRFVPVSAVPEGQVHGIVGDGKGNLWIAHQDQGLLHIVEGRVAERVSLADLRRKESVLSFLPDSAPGGLWLGFFKGGVAHVKAGKITASYSGADGLGEGDVSDLQLDQDGTLWATTPGGLSRLKNGRVTTLTSRNGLPCDGVNWMAEDDTGSFWLGMACGLVRISRPEMEGWAMDSRRVIQTTVFDGSDGVRSHATTSSYSPRVAKTRDGKLWFLPFDGVSVIDPSHLAFNKLPPPVYIEQITADRKVYETSANLRLPPLVRDLEIDYTALSLVAPEKNRFRVKLEGRDRDWKDAGNERKAFYNDLPPRSYRFRVMASNNSRVWNESGASFDFSIAPAYYQTRWFQVSCAAAFLGLLWGLYRYRLHQVAREFNLRLEERVNERTRLARDLHDTLLQGFQGLMLRLQAINESLPAGEVKDELERTLDRGDQVVAESRKAVHNLRLSTVVTNDLARAIGTTGEELSSEGSATFELLVEGDTRELHPIVRDEVYRITREALRNAFMHAKARHIEAEITYEEQRFRVRIRDDGEGIAPALLQDGRAGHYGLAGMRERAGEIGAALDIWSGDGKGTEIDLSIPGSIAYSKRAYSKRAGEAPGSSDTRAFREKGE